MARRLLVFGVVLVAGLLAAWWLRAEAGRAPLARGTREQIATAASAPPPTLEPPRAADVVPQRESVVSAQAEEVSEPQARPAAEGGPVLVVRAVDRSSGEPLARVRMYIHPRAPGSSSSSTHVDGARGSLSESPLTALDGLVEFELPAAVELTLSASGEDGVVGRASVEVEALAPGERRELTLELPTGDDLHYFGRVLARDDRSPVAGARIELVRGETSYVSVNDGPVEEQYEEHGLAETETDGEGLFELSLASWKNPDLRIQAPGFAVRLLQVASEHETPAQAKLVLLARAASLRARLLDAGGGAVGDGTVRLWTEGYHLGESDHGEVYLPSVSEPEWTGDAEATGLCTLLELPPDVPFHVEVWRGSELVKRDLPELVLKPGETREVEWRLGSGCTLTGSVVDQLGEPVADQALWLQRADRAAPRFFQKYHSGEVVVEARSDDEGRFRFADVGPGQWWLGPASERDDWDAADPRAVAPLAQVVEVLEGNPSQDVQLSVYRGLYIRGRVLDPAGEPAPETFLFGSTEAAGWMLSARTGADGAFAMGPLVPGRYSLTAHGWTHADSDSVEASAGDEGVVLRLKAGGSVSGTVLDGATGLPCVASITVARAGDLESIHVTDTEDDGSFHFEGLEPGTYDVAARASGQRVGVSRSVAVRAGVETKAVVVTLEPGALLRVRYAGRDGYMQYRVSSAGVPLGFDGVKAGSSSESAVPAGHVTVECSWGETTETKELDFVAGQEQELVLGGD